MRPTRTRCVWLAATVLLTGAALACTPPSSRDEGTVSSGTGLPADAPSWLESVSPAPGARLSGAAMVTVNTDFVTGNQEVRLEIDGVDVTELAVAQPPSSEQAEVVTPNRLVYDPREVTDPPVVLDPGRHTATVRALDFAGFESGQSRSKGTFTWTFEVL